MKNNVINQANYFVMVMISAMLSLIAFQFSVIVKDNNTLYVAACIGIVLFMINGVVFLVKFLNYHKN